MHKRIHGLGAALAALVLLPLAGCTPPAGVDGDLVGDWSVPPEPASFRPAAGACHPREYRPAGPLADYAPVDCAQEHATETVHLGEFPGEAAARVTPPPVGSPEWQDAYAACDEAAAEYLGADFRHAELWLGVAVPSSEAWDGGARWFRCEVTGPDRSALDRAGSLAGALAGDSELLRGCYEAEVDDDDGTVTRFDPVDCDEPHNTEFVGVWRAPDGPPREVDEDVHEGCREVAAGYVDVPVDSGFPRGTIADPITEDDWEQGDRGFRCYLWLVDEEVDESLAGVGPSGLPG